jgi:NADH-quinone oxidoreductase subunit M
MIRKVFYGNTNELTVTGYDIKLNEKLALGIVVILVFWMGIYPQGMLNVTQEISNSILHKADVLQLTKKH